jgi:WD40 repeat protein
MTMSRKWIVLLLILLATLLTGCGAEAWERDPDVQAAKAACKGSGKELDYACIERHAVESLNPDVCRLAGIAIDDMCLQAVYEAAGDPAICERIYLRGVRPNCQAYYAVRSTSFPTPPSRDSALPTLAPTLPTTVSPKPEAVPTAVVPTGQVTPQAHAAVEIEPFVELARLGKGTPRDVVYAPDGHEVAVVTSLGVYFFDPTTLAFLRFFESDSDLYHVGFAPDWRSLAWPVHGQLQLADLATGGVVGTLEVPSGRVGSPAFSPDGKLVAVIVFPPGEEVYTGDVLLWRAEDGTVVNRWDAGAAHLAFVADGETLAGWHAQVGMSLWRVPGGELLGSVAVHPVDVAFAAEGEVMAVGELIGIRLWRTSDWSFLGSLAADSDALGQIALSRDGTSLAAATVDGIGLWQVGDDGAPALWVTGSDGSVSALAFSPDGDELAWAQAAVTFARASDGEVLGTVHGFLPPVRGLAVPSTGNSVAVVVDLVDTWESETLSVYLWRAGDSEAELLPAAGPALSVAYASDGALLAAGGWDGRVRLVEVASGALLRTIDAHRHQVHGVAFSPDGRLLASGAMAEVRVWSVEDGSQVRRVVPPGDAGWIDDVAFSPDGNLLAACRSGSVWLWSTTGWGPIRALYAKSDMYRGRIAFAPDGSAVVLAQDDGMYVWHLPEGELVRILDLGATGEAELAYSPDGSLLAVNVGSEVQLRRVSDGRLLQTLTGARSPLTDVVFLPDGRRIVSASWDGTVRLWGLKEQE